MMEANKPAMQKIDAHQHFWKFDPVRDSWITSDMARIRRDFLPEDLEPILQENGLDGCVVVQSDQSEAENEFQLGNARAHDFIKGIVGWVDLKAVNVEERLAYYAQFPEMKGFRHVLQGEADRAHMLNAAFKRGIGKLKRFGYTYDILIFPDQLKHTRPFVAEFPEQPFVIDHIAKPDIKKKRTDNWEKEIGALGAYENVYCKISGMVTEADWQHWQQEDFLPYMEVVVEAFGTNRIMYGSDWPVCLVAADSYGQMMGIVKDYFSTFSTNEQDLFFGGNAADFYRLNG